ncbi:MAG: hypothetical protein IT427_11210 [Pirellulales bacterium]|nr:hypothetical protein [Pirellulales bacterium]
MDAYVRSLRTTNGRSLPDRFLQFLPRIRSQAQSAFCFKNPDEREELVAETVANAYVAYRRLADQGRAELAYATPLAQYAIRQIRVGRRVGARLNRHEVLSPYARYMQGFKVERLDQPGQPAGTWNEVLLEDRRAGPAETAAARIDLAAWLRMLPTAKRQVAAALATGEPTSAVARRFGVTPGRISQLRRWLRSSWEQFHGQPAGV